MPFTMIQKKVLAITPKVPASFSFLGSCVIIYESILDFRRGKGSSVMKRALIGMSFFDLLSSIAWFLSTWVTPVESGAPYAVGNERTCAFQSFLMQLSIAAPLYNGALILYYFLIIKYRWTNARLLKLEPYIHAFIWIWCLGTSIVLHVLDLANFVGPICATADPPECSVSVGGDSSPSICGKAGYFDLAFFAVPLWIVIITAFYALVTMYFTVKKSVDRMSIYAFRGAAQGHYMSRSSPNVKMVASRSAQYSIAFLLTWLPGTANSIAYYIGNNYFWIACLWTLAEPFQGCWNVLIFLHNRPSSKTKVKKLLSFGLWKPNDDDDDGTTCPDSLSPSNTLSSWRTKFASSRRVSLCNVLEGFSANQLEASQNDVEEGSPEMHPELADEEKAIPDQECDDKDEELVTDI